MQRNFFDLTAKQQGGLLSLIDKENLNLISIKEVHKDLIYALLLNKLNEYNVYSFFSPSENPSYLHRWENKGSVLGTPFTHLAENWHHPKVHFPPFDGEEDSQESIFVLFYFKGYKGMKAYSLAYGYCDLMASHWVTMPEGYIVQTEDVAGWTKFEIPK